VLAVALEVTDHASSEAPRDGHPIEVDGEPGMVRIGPA